MSEQTNTALTWLAILVLAILVGAQMLWPPQGSPTANCSTNIYNNTTYNCSCSDSPWMEWMGENLSNGNWSIVMWRNNTIEKVVYIPNYIHDTTYVDRPVYVTPIPTGAPTPTVTPTISPTANPTASPTPTATPTPSPNPTVSPTPGPSCTPKPTCLPPPWQPKPPGHH